MAKKRSKRATAKPKNLKKYKLDKKFNCPVCNHEAVVNCKVFKSSLNGFARCSVCEASFKCEINKLDQAIDVYNKWLDSEK